MSFTRQETEASRCRTSTALNASKGRCFQPEPADELTAADENEDEDDNEDEDEDGENQEEG